MIQPAPLIVRLANLGMCHSEWPTSTRKAVTRPECWFVVEV